MRPRVVVRHLLSGGAQFLLGYSLRAHIQKNGNIKNGTVKSTHAAKGYYAILGKKLAPAVLQTPQGA